MDKLRILEKNKLSVEISSINTYIKRNKENEKILTQKILALKFFKQGVFVGEWKFFKSDILSFNPSSRHKKKFPQKFFLMFLPTTAFEKIWATPLYY